MIQLGRSITGMGAVSMDEVRVVSVVVVVVVSVVVVSVVVVVGVVVVVVSVAVMGVAVVSPLAPMCGVGSVEQGFACCLMRRMMRVPPVDSDSFHFCQQVHRTTQQDQSTDNSHKARCYMYVVHGKQDTSIQGKEHKGYKYRSKVKKS